MELATESFSDIDKAWLLENLAKAARVWFFGMLLSGITVLFFILQHSPHFPHPQNFLEKYVAKNYHWALLCNLSIILLSGASILFTTIKFRLGWKIGMFSITLFLLGIFIPPLATQTWYHHITQEHPHMDVILLFAFLGIICDYLVAVQVEKLEESSEKGSYWLGILFVIFIIPLVVLSLHHKIKRIEAHLQQTYQEAKTFPKDISYSIDWHNISPYKAQTDLQGLGGYGAMIVAKAYQRAGYETSVVAWNNLMQLGRYVNTLQSQGLLSGGIPWQITPSASTLRHLHRLEPYVYFFQHHNIHFYTAHSGVNFFERYRRIQALHNGDFFIRNLASIRKVEAVSRWLEPGYRYEISLTLGTEGVSKYYEDHVRQYKKWQHCMEREGSSFCSDLKPKRGYIPNN